MALRPPQLIVGARMLYVVWLPADPVAAATLVPGGLTPREGTPVFMNQYVVDRAGQTSNEGSEDGFGAYSLTYLGVELAGLDTEDGTPARWWTHYLNSSANMIRYAVDHGVPASGGETTLELDNGQLVRRHSSTAISSFGRRPASTSAHRRMRPGSSATSRLLTERSVAVATPS